jgi:hypothetical protein
MRELNLVQPVPCGWSCGSIVMLDYAGLGEDAMGGMCSVDAPIKL